MSNVYSMEPRTNGKVNLNTTYGTISVELWGKECPLACRNFIQLCLEGYYNESPFDRLVPGFCLQAGKPAKFFEDEPDRNGKAAILNGRFSIETHSRLRFSRRGLLGMVALDTNDNNRANGSQFFFTLSETPELNGRNTLFGRVVGDTIFNLLRMAELEIDPKTESPLYPPLIIDTEVIINPFKDIIPRDRVCKNPDIKISDKSSSDSLKKKNISLLSFADSEKDVDHSNAYTRDKNSSSAKDQKILQKESLIHHAQASSSLQFLQQMKAVQMRDTEQKIKSMEIELGLLTDEKHPNEICSKDSSPSLESKPNISALEKYKLKFSESKKRKATINSKDEMETILFLNSFRKKIQNTGIKTEDTHPEPSKKHLDICKLHGLLNCLSCKNNFNINLNTETSEFDEKDWLMHKLVFDRRELEGQIREDLKELVVIDPKEQIEKSNKNITKINKNK